MNKKIDLKITNGFSGYRLDFWDVEKKEWLLLYFTNAGSLLNYLQDMLDDDFSI